MVKGMFVSCSVLGGLRTRSSNEKLSQDLTHTLYRIKEAGYRHVEVWMDDRPSWLINTYKQTLDDLGLDAYSIHLPKFLVAFEEGDFNRANEIVFPFIKSLGTKVAVFHPPDREMMSEGDEWKKRLDTLLDLAEDSGCTLTIENVPYLPDVDKFIMDQIESNDGRPLGITIDIEFMYISGSKMRQMTSDFGNSIHNVHFRDSDGSLVDEEGYRKYLIPGQGEVDLLSVVRELHTAGYDKALTVEVSHRQRSNIIEAKIYADSCLSKVK
ncbi:MAG: sugar phosphate isomerase/epimerase family protein [Candidatus Thorarchaeota archaeon]